MYFYFSASYPCAIKLNGIFFGTIDKTAKFIDNISPSPTLLELYSLCENGENCHVLLDENVFSSTRKNLAVTDLNGGYLLHFLGKTTTADFYLLYQESFDSKTTTIFNENSIKITIESQNDYFIDSLDFSARQVKVKRFHQNDTPFLAVSFCDYKNTTIVYCLGEKIKKVFFDIDVSFSIDDCFCTEKKIEDIFKHTVKSTWEYDGEKFFSKSSVIEKNTDKSINDLVSEIIPYAFLEEALLKGDLSPYLCKNVLENKDKLYEYLGNFIGIMPPPIFRNDDEIGLIYKKAELKYYVKYARFELKDNKIFNIKLH